MAKLYFRHGVVSSAKTLNLLACAHSYEVQGKRVKVVKPAMDTRFGVAKVQSRAGLDRQADILVDGKSVFEAGTFDGVDCILVDEAQFVSPLVIEQLRRVASMEGVPVICYGLRTDFRSRLFPGSKRLMELADVIEEVKTTCTFCNRRAILNLKSVDGVPTLSGPTVCLGCEELYVPTCYRHFVEKIQAGKHEPIDFQQAALAGDLADAAQAEEQAQAAKNIETEDTAEKPGFVPPARKKDWVDDGDSSEASHETPPHAGQAVKEPECEATPEKEQLIKAC